MPVTHVSMRAGKSEAWRQAILDGIACALHETFSVPKDNQFMIVSEHEAANFRYSSTYLGIARSDDLVFIQITANNTRNIDQKKALFRRLADLLAESPGLRQEDVFIGITEVAKENWSLGNGLAQYA